MDKTELQALKIKLTQEAQDFEKVYEEARMKRVALKRKSEKDPNGYYIALGEAQAREENACKNSSAAAARLAAAFGAFGDHRRAADAFGI